LPHRHGGQVERLDAGGGPLSWRALAALGLSGGLVPSTSAVVLLLGAIQLERLFLGGVLVLAFGVGMAAALVGAGLGVVLLSRRAAGAALASSRWGERLAGALQPTAGLVMLLVGAYLVTRALGELTA
jgi:ABC-type nickel/cobalt efflux system permease component RcnA